MAAGEPGDRRINSLMSIVLAALAALSKMDMDMISLKSVIISVRAGEKKAARSQKNGVSR